MFFTNMKAHLLFSALLLLQAHEAWTGVDKRVTAKKIDLKAKHIGFEIRYPQDDNPGPLRIRFFNSTTDETIIGGETGPVGLELGGTFIYDECDLGDTCNQWPEYNLRFISNCTFPTCSFEWTVMSDENETVVSSFYTSLHTQDHLYGAGEQMFQNWPIDPVPHPFDVPYVTDESISPPFQHWGGVSERYWLTSGGGNVYVPENVPLFFKYKRGLNQTKTLYFESKSEPPYKQTKDGSAPHKVVMGAGYNVKDVHVDCAIQSYFELPTAIPDSRIMTDPIWSTWAMYKTDINEDKVIDFAKDITRYGFTNSQLEIDDDWETCYGSAEFNREKFPNVEDMVATLKSMGFRVTLWIHPFINQDCTEAFSYADAQGFLVKDSEGKTGITKWWNSRNAGIIDPTNPAAVKWWTDRLRKLQEDIGIDSFKFDAGETVYLPDDYVLQVEPSLQPQQYSTAYVDMVKQFGSMIEVRVGFRSQAAPVFVRMLDKSSGWSDANGLRTMIPSVLQIGISGYPFVLPDMIGGNGYGPTGFPSKELYIRWAQVNTFMPALQLSIAPWYYDEETVNITRAMTQLHKKYADKIIELAEQATRDGTPINRPLWWIAPEDEQALTCGDEFLLGDDLLVAPVVTRGEQRDIYLPAGNWRDELNEDHPVYTGPLTLKNYKVLLHQLPYFTRVSSA